MAKMSIDVFEKEVYEYFETYFQSSGFGKLTGRNFCIENFYESEISLTAVGRYRDRDGDTIFFEYTHFENSKKIKIAEYVNKSVVVFKARSR